MIMKTLFLLTALTASAILSASGGEFRYSIAEIPESLLKNANSVQRENHTNYTITDNTHARESVKYAITLLNAKASDDGELRVFYDDNSTVGRIDFKVYNALGIDITRTYKELKVTDESAIPDGIMYSDHRCKIIAPVFAQFPVTIEYTYEVSYSHTDFYPRWMPLRATNMSVQKATFTLTTPVSLKPRYMQVSKVAAPAVENLGAVDRLRWEVNEITAIEDEPFSPPVYEMVPYLLLAPSSLKVGDFEGPFLTWNDFGKFQAYLNRDRDILPPETIAGIKDLVKDCPDAMSKIRKVYKYMQSKTRYVGVEIGIGGIQPIPADYIDKKGYGDCKGLVIYTKALLRAVGIESYFTLVNAGRNANPVITDFVCWQFNHAILCVPVDNDTTWLECTSQRQAFGFLGSFTHNRHVLVVNNNGGILVRSPRYGSEVNIGIRNAYLNVDEGGNAMAKIVTSAEGLESENIESVITQSPEDQKKGYYIRSGFPDSKVNNLKYRLVGDFLPVGSEEVEAFIPAFASKSNNRFFVPVVLPDRINKIPAGNTRTFPFVINRSFVDYDTIRITIPAGLSLEFKPDVQAIDSKFGRYSLSVEQRDRQIICIRRFMLNEIKAEPAEYPDFIAFLKKTVKADQAKVVLVQK